MVASTVAAGVAISTTSASASGPALAKRTPAQLIAAVESSKTTALSGVIGESANLGLPSLPGSGHSSASLSWQTFVTGTHSAKVWIDGADKQRVALLGELSEADVVHNGPDVWTYTSDTNTVTHTTLSKHTGSKHDGKTGGTDTNTPGEPSATDLTPAAAANKLLNAVTPSTAVGVDSSRTVAGRAAYTLTLRPKDTRSTVSKATIAIDAKKFVPLQVQVFGAGSTAAFETGFKTISFATPSAATFAFKTPVGATTSNNPFASRDHHGDHGRGKNVPRRYTHSTPPNAPTTPKETVIGSGWTSVLELPKGAQSALSGGTLRDATSPVGSSGQRLLHTALINALIVPDGRTFVGAVSPAVLQHVAAITPR
ncbi:MAG: LolA family protein [Jatrophihabitans sp.]